MPSTSQSSSPLDPAADDNRMPELSVRLAACGLRLFGGFAPAADDEVPALSGNRPARAVHIVGNAGPKMWRVFQDQRQDEPDPLDSWTRRVLEPIAADLGMEVVFPFAGPPWLPFQKWARRTGTLFPTPFGPSIHPQFGTWFGLRGAFLSPLPYGEADPPAHSPCDTCAGRYCLHACQSGGISAKGYDICACVANLRTMPGYACIKNGCRARHACPIGRTYAYGQDQAEFHMRALLERMLPLLGGR